MVIICKSSDKKIHRQCIYILDIRLKSEVLVDSLISFSEVIAKINGLRINNRSLFLIILSFLIISTYELLRN